MNKELLIKRLYDYICISWCEWNGTGEAGDCPDCPLKQDLEKIISGAYMEGEKE